MSRLPMVKARNVIRALERAGFIRIRQKGSHVFFRHPETGRTTVIPVHEREDIDRDLLVEILNDVGLSQEDFRRYL